MRVPPRRSINTGASKLPFGVGTLAQRNSASACVGSEKSSPCAVVILKYCRHADDSYKVLCIWVRLFIFCVCAFVVTVRRSVN